MTCEHLAGLYAETEITLAHIEELDERWRKFNFYFRQQILMIQNFAEEIFRPNRINVKANAYDTLDGIRRVIHKRNAIAIRENRQVSNWYHTICGIASEVCKFKPYDEQVNARRLIITFSAFVKLNGIQTPWHDSKYGFAQVKLVADVIDGIGHIFDTVTIQRDIIHQVHPRYIEHEALTGTEFDCVHNLIISCPYSGRVLFESADGAIVHDAKPRSYAEMRLDSKQDFNIYNIPESVLVSFTRRNERKVVANLNPNYDILNDNLLIWS
jgi:hypothetical protein